MAPSTSDRGKHRKGNALAIRLTESAVFLPIDTFAPVRRRSRQPEPRTSTLRGLLVLDLVKSTKISSIDIELTAVTSTAWPEGVGARRIDVTEDHQVFRASTVFFSGSSHPTAAASRRTASIGPGISYARFNGHGSSPEPDDDSLDEPDLDGWTDLRRRSGPGADTALTIPPPLSPPPPFVEGNSAGGPSHGISSGTPSEIYVRPPLQPRQSSRRFSVDGNHFRPRPLYETRHEVQDFYGNLSRSELESLAPIPPYSPYPPESPLSVPAMSGVVSPTTGPAQSLEEFRNSLHSSLRSSQLHLTEPSPTGSALSLTSASASASAEGPGLISRQVGATAGEAQARSSPTPRHRSLSSTRTSAANRPSHSGSTLPPIQAQDIEPPSPASAPFHERHASPVSAHREPDRERDREHRGRKRFSLTGLFKASHSVGKILPSRERPQETSSTGRALSVDTDAERFPRRPSPTERESSALEEMDEEPEEDYRRHRSKERGRGTISRIIKGNLIDGGKEKEDWKEFKPGTYSYPISFTIPADSPPSMRCEYGSVVWQLKANVHRPGAFKTKLTATREVTVIACPTEEDTEDTENIIVERHWEQQLQYLIAVSGRSFYIGGTMPVMLTLMPLTKMKIYRLSIYIEERVDYYTNMRRIARTDLPSRICLLSVKAGRSSEPILPLDSDSPDALRTSPLFPLFDPHASDLELSEIASTLMGPGPWTFHQNLQLPRSCDELHFTNRNRRSNIEVTHLLKVVMRVQRGDDTHLDPKTGKRKLFDIVVQTPVLILSCRCNPEWMGLPRYAEALEDTTLIVPSCPCQDERTRLLTGQPAGPFGSGAFLERITSRRSSDNDSACGSGGEATVVHPRSPAAIQLANYTDAMLQSNELFERLVSGQESVNGEVPPAYAPPPAGRVLAGTGVGVI